MCVFPKRIFACATVFRVTCATPGGNAAAADWNGCLWTQQAQGKLRGKILRQILPRAASIAGNPRPFPNQKPVILLGFLPWHGACSPDRREGVGSVRRLVSEFDHVASFRRRIERHGCQALAASASSSTQSTGFGQPFEISSPASAATNSGPVATGFSAPSQLSPATMQARLAAQIQSSTTNASATTAVAPTTR